jgi:hypothetical protein
MGRAAGKTLVALARARRRAPRRSGGRAPYRWTDDALERELRAFVAGRSTWPTYVEFDAADRGDLRSALAELGGQDYWAERLGFNLDRSRRRDRYSDADALRDARAAMAESDDGRLPGERRLRRMGYPQLATRVRQAGGAVKFAAFHDLPGPASNPAPGPGM